jgi:hypothetical protein
MKMTQIGRYCKAYAREMLARFPGWSENPVKQVEGQEPATESGYLFLQQDYTVTSGIYLDEGVVFNRVTPEWIEFCENELRFEIPSYQTTRRSQTPSQGAPQSESAVQTATA